MAKPKKEKKPFDWSSQRLRHFAIKFAYEGTAYHGVAWQPPTIHPNRASKSLPVSVHVPTVEGELIGALEKTKLIKSRLECRFSRCGRTDKGVHAAGNYLSLDLRVLPGAIEVTSTRRKDKDVNMAKNLDYVRILNAVLPKDIRVVSVRQVPDNFDARFSCLFRRYEYYFPCIGLDVERMNLAAKQYIGTHDFSNFCKMDVANARDFKRTLLRFDICKLDDGIFAVARCDGLSFLWHQVRCMMAVLLLIGRGYEEPSVIASMFDIDHMPRKPQYDLAPEEGLILKECFFDLEEATTGVGHEVAFAYRELLLRQLLNKHILSSLNGHGPLDKAPNEEEYKSSLTMKGLPKDRYIKLLNRPTENSYQEKLASFKASEERKNQKNE